MARKIGILFGEERSFPPAIVDEVNRRGDGRVVAESVHVGAVHQDDIPSYDLILDRISHQVPFYRTLVKVVAARGTQVINNPFWWSADDRFLSNVIAEAAGVAVPRTVLLPHKAHPPDTGPDTFSNLEFPLRWDEVFAYLGFPIFLKPANGGGRGDVYRVADPEEFFRAYDGTHTLSMIAQEAIESAEYYQCYALGRERVRVMRYDPRMPAEYRYVRDAPPPDGKLLTRVRKDCLNLCRELGYDFNTLEFAVRDGVPYAIDFMNPAPDCDPFSVGQENFDWVLHNAAEILIDRALNPRPLEVAGKWARRRNPRTTQG
ncbi:MAG: hypothetical protein PVF68_12710 [Acidobacteriota bacterium]